MDKIKKVLRKYPRKTQLMLKAIFDEILSGKTDGYDVVKLTGMRNLYRIRKGDFRIIFKMSGENFEIVRITTRGDTTHKKLR